MGYFDWDPKFEMGVTAMDRQHQQLIAVMNRLHCESQKSEKKETLLATLRELRTKTDAHFQEEERYMTSIGYKDLKSHSLIHRQLMSSLDEHVKNYSNSDLRVVPPALFTFLKLWLSSHILGIDMRYAEVAKKGAA